MPYEQYIKLINTSKTYSQRVVSYIYQLLLSIYDNSKSFAASNSEDALIFSDAVNYMNKNLDKIPAVKEIAHYCGTSESTLKRIFTKFSGLGVHKYMLTLKINTAARLIKEGFSVTDIAEELGFSSQGYFSFVFKREMNKTPTEYRNIFYI